MNHRLTRDNRVNLHPRDSRGRRETRHTNMRRSKRSVVWEHFNLINDDKDANCKLSGTTFKFSSATSSPRYHLHNLHAAVLQGGSPSPSQPTIAAVMGRRVCDDRKAEGITQRICGMIKKDMMPISTTDGEGFREWEWWKVNERRFPRLANVARRYLCIPDTSVSSERVFSAAGLTVNRLRTRLTPDHVYMLIFLNKNKGV